MEQIKVETLVLGPIETNCYLVVNETRKEVVVIDPAAEAGEITEAIDRLQCKPVAVLLTHGHFDHIGAVEALREIYQLPVCAMEQERETLASPMINLSAFHGDALVLAADRWLRGGERLDLAGLDFDVIYTPGHTMGGCCYYVGERALLFSGDTLFRGSIGRTDFYGGDMRQLLQGLRTKLLTLPEETIVYPGHGSPSVIGWEKRFNPYYSAYEDET